MIPQMIDHTNPIEICPDCGAKLRYEDIEQVWYCVKCYYEKSDDIGNQEDSND